MTARTNSDKGFDDDDDAWHHKRRRVSLPSNATRDDGGGNQPLTTQVIRSAWRHPQPLIASSRPLAPAHHSTPKPLNNNLNETATARYANREATQALPKRKFSRSRSGCNTCRTRKLKCDEERPRCRRCTGNGKDCIWHTEDEDKRNTATTSPASRRPPVATDSPIKDTRPAESIPSLPQPRTQLQLNVAQSFTQPPHPRPESPQHLDDWIDLLCASIGNHVQQHSSPSTASTAGSNASSKNAPRCTEGRSSDRSSGSSRTGRFSGYSDPDSGLSTLADAAVGGNRSAANDLSWLHEDWLALLTASPAVPEPWQTEAFQHASAAAHTGLSGLEHISESDLQKRIRTLCVTKIQLESVSFFFNTTARCFHLLTAETNVWRIFFAQLASASPMILDFIACFGLTHLSVTQDHSKKALAHAQFSRCKAEWDVMVGPLDSHQSIESTVSRIITAHNALEMIAGAIVIGHIEQFNRGFATCSCQCTALALRVIRKALSRSNLGESSLSWVKELDQGPGSIFRFFVRIVMWWETMSLTLGPGSGEGDVQDIFRHVYQWEAKDGPGPDPIGCSTQCVVGWPLDLLDALHQTTCLSKTPEISAFRPPPSLSVPLVMPSGTLSYALEGSIPLDLQHQIDTVETQIRLARPLPLVQDDSIAAELRYLLFECLQSACLVYFCKSLLKSTDAVWFEVDKVTRFLERKQRGQSAAASGGAQAVDGTHGATTAGSATGHMQLTQAMEMRGKWWIRAPDNALIWAYATCAAEIFGNLDPSVEVVQSGRPQDGRYQLGKGKPTMLALGSQLSLGSEVYAAYAQSRSEARQRCRRSLLLWERFDETQCIFLVRHFVKAIWDRRDLYEQQQQRLESETPRLGHDSALAESEDQGAVEPYDLAAEVPAICRQRRWTQPLMF
ncbi:uncharacterized protein MEPE_05649 [Melanopsichium pennsylvanicum]|uniref:Zn(2)-C6 fungal-type domain-containing protein n=2 Tax=Melanopsichium pennsylvanicum TaxID=63383 RepID=A0AAJ5C7I9_9BASI|nr:conserved hypothetical protein [Melanopsichium pennsylvanicum 4]SNX86940.1 uncharacterized protein MEPE_05649 [Melanopsichium pennsylvanicum]